MWVLGILFLALMHLMVPMSVAYVTFNYWAWPLIQADSSWQYFAFFSSAVLAVASLFGVVLSSARILSR